jgi:hypothetical protein
MNQTTSLGPAFGQPRRALVEAIADALDTFTPEECKNYIVNSGYRLAPLSCLAVPAQKFPLG